MRAESRRLPGWAWTALGFFPPFLLNNRWAWRWCLTNPGLLSPGDFARGTLVPVVIGALLSCVLLGLGAALGRIAGAKEEDEGMAWPRAFALGFGGLGVSLFALGLAGGLGTRLILAVVAAAGVAALWGSRALPALELESPAHPWARWLQGLLLYAGWRTLVLALAPPTEWDVLTYHLPIPKLYLEAGAIREIPWLLHSHWPHLAEVLYCLPLALGQDAVAALLHLACSWALVAAAYFAARRDLGVTPAWLAAALVASQPAFLRIAGTAHADGALALFVFLAGWTLWEWRKDPRPRRLVLAGVLGGLAASCKLFGAAPIAAWTLWLLARKRLEDAARFAGCALAVVAPWYLKTLIGAGNPVWPFFSGVLGGRWGASVIEGPYLVSTRWPWPPDGSLLLRYGPQHLLAPLGVLGLYAWRRRLGVPEFVRFWLVPAALYAPLVLRQQEAWRFLLPFYPALALLLAGWAFEAAKASRAARVLACVSIGFALWPALAANAGNQLFPVLAARSRLAPDREPRRLYLERTLDHYLAFEGIRRDLPPSSRVLLYREVRGYYLGLDYRWGDPLNQAVIAYSRLPGAESLYRRLRELGITHVLINEPLAMDKASARYYDERTTRLVNETLRRYAEPPRRYGPIALYRLR